MTHGSDVACGSPTPFPFRSLPRVSASVAGEGVAPGGERAGRSERVGGQGGAGRRVHRQPLPRRAMAPKLKAKDDGSGEEKLTRIAVISGDRCKPKKCKQECKKSCPVVKIGAPQPPPPRRRSSAASCAARPRLSVGADAVRAPRVQASFVLRSRRPARLPSCPRSCASAAAFASRHVSLAHCCSWPAGPGALGLAPAARVGMASKLWRTLTRRPGRAPQKCPFEAIMIINLPKDLEKDTTHRYGPNSFKLHRCVGVVGSKAGRARVEPTPWPPLHRLPTPRPGQVLGLVGTNGIGKSTALKILAGKLKPNLGRFTVRPESGTGHFLRPRLTRPLLAVAPSEPARLAGDPGVFPGQRAAELPHPHPGGQHQGHHQAPVRGRHPEGCAGQRGGGTGGQE